MQQHDDPTDTSLFRSGYALLKQVPTAYAIASDYGSLDLTDDDELRAAVVAAVTPILKRRIQVAKGEPIPPDPADKALTAALAAFLADEDILRLQVLADEQHLGSPGRALAEILEASLDDLVGEVDR